MPDFRLNAERYSKARGDLNNVERVVPDPQLVEQEVQALLASATKAKRALIAADSAQSLLMYHACNLDRQLTDLAMSQQTVQLPVGQVNQLRKSLAVVSERLRRTENYAHACRNQYLPHLQQQLEQLDDDPEDAVRGIIS